MNFAWQEEHVFGGHCGGPGRVRLGGVDGRDEARLRKRHAVPGKASAHLQAFRPIPDPQDGSQRDQVAELASVWALRHFADFEVAIVLHDDNENRIPHAHIVVNNTNLVTERRLQTPDPLELNRSLQDLAEERGYRFMRNDTVREEDEGQARKATPATLQKTYIRRAEREIAERGWLLLGRGHPQPVTVAKALARNEDEFMAVLEALEVDVSQNSEKSWRRDWIYSLSDHPTWRIGGEKLGLSFGQEALRRRFDRIAAWHPAPAASRRILSEAESAIELNDLSELERLAGAIEAFMSANAHSLADLDRRIERLEGRADGDSAERAERCARCARTRRRTGSCPKPRQTRRQRQPQGEEKHAVRRDDETA